MPDRIATGWSKEVEDAFRSSAPRGASLTEHLQSLAHAARESRPEYMALVDRFVARLNEAKAGGSAPEVGANMPLFSLPDHEGQLVSLDELIGGRPTVVAIVRGHWCPFCRLNVIGLAEVQRQYADVPIVIVTPELAPFSRLLRREAGDDLTILSDPGLGYILSLGLVVMLDASLAKLVEAAGWDVPLYQGTGWLLPIPSVFVVAADGRIVERHIDPDYRRRMEVSRLRDAIERACAIAPSREMR